MRVALDAMGGDYAPAPNVDGAVAALKAVSDLEILMVGDRPQLETLLEKTGYSGERLQIVESDGFVEMHEKPTDALRKKPNCSISVCWRLMAEKNVDAVVSAGHTGAVVAAGLRTRLFLKHVKRPGIAVALPTLKGRVVLLDVGANPVARPEHLLQYGVMGAIYAQKILGIENPRIGLMNIGSEEGKGTDLYRDAHTLLSQSHLKNRYIGNVEGRDLYAGDVDVIICEGFVGNVILKVSEGMADFFFKSVTPAVLGRLEAERGHAKQAFEDVGRRYQYSEEGGAPLLGIDGTCIICHGSSEARSITNALRVSCKLKQCNINDQIVESLSETASDAQT